MSKHKSREPGPNWEVERLGDRGVGFGWGGACGVQQAGEHRTCAVRTLTKHHHALFKAWCSSGEGTEAAALNLRLRESLKSQTHDLTETVS